VIIQNFLPKPETAMHAAPACPHEEFVDAIALARIILPPDVHVQAPPNLSDDFGTLLDAGIDDWGGVSPVTSDHVNPERPWPPLERLWSVTEAVGCSRVFASGRSRAWTSWSRCSRLEVPKSLPWPLSPTSFAARSSGTRSRTSATATSTTPTSARSSAGSADSPKVPSR